MNKTIFYTLLILSLSSCAFRNEDEVKEALDSMPERLHVEDIDGDHISNEDELKKGTNPYVSNIPNVLITKAKNPIFSFKFHDIKLDEILEYEISDIDKNGTVYASHIIKGITRNGAAKMARYKNHTTSHFLGSDFDFLEVLEIDKSKSSFHILNLSKYLDNSLYETNESSLTFNIDINLSEFEGFQTIKNLSFNIYIYNHKKSSYDLVTTHKEERTISSGAIENIEIEVKNLNLDMLLRSLRFEKNLIYIEIKDFDIVERDLSYATLMNSVRKNTIQLALNTPLTSKNIYVAANHKKTLKEILDKVFDQKVLIENEVLTKINQFENNLADFKDLEDVKDENKLGKWFIQTSKIDKDLLSYKFKSADKITLSYVLGVDLYRVRESIRTFERQSLSTKEKSQTIDIDSDISDKTKLTIYLELKNNWGDKLSVSNRDYRETCGSASGNRVCSALDINCKVDVYSSTKFEKSLELDKLLKNTFLKINGNEISLEDLLTSKSLNLKVDNKRVIITLYDLRDLIEPNAESENIEVSLIFKKIINSYPSGTFLHAASGKHKHICAEVVGKASKGWKSSLSKRSIMKGQLNRYNSSFSDDMNLVEDMSLSALISLESYYN